MDEPKAVARNECVDACKEYLHVSGNRRDLIRGNERLYNPVSSVHTRKRGTIIAKVRSRFTLEVTLPLREGHARSLRSNNCVLAREELTTARPMGGSRSRSRRVVFKNSSLDWKN